MSAEIILPTAGADAVPAVAGLQLMLPLAQQLLITVRELALTGAVGALQLLDLGLQPADVGGELDAGLAKARQDLGELLQRGVGL